MLSSSRIRRALSGLSALLLPTTLIAQAEHHTLAGDRVAVYNLAGKLRVQPGPGSQVTVDMKRGGHDASQLRVLQGDIRGFNTLRVVYPGDRVIYPQMGYRSRTQLRVNPDGTFDDNDHDGWGSRDRVEIRDSGSGLEAFADLVVSVPKGQRIVLHWGVGDATVSNVDGDIRVSVAAAHVSAEHTRGILKLDTGSGGVDVIDAQGEVTLDTGSGGVTVNGVRGESLLMDTGSGSIRGGDVDVKTLKMDVGSGGLRLDRIKAPRVTADAGSGGVDLSFLAPVTDLSAESGSGGVTVRLPAAQTGDVDIETGSGGIDTDFPITSSRLARHHIRGTIGSGGGKIRIEAGSGSVRLLKS
jgi:lia operon protein LiaG